MSNNTNTLPLDKLSKKDLVSILERLIAGEVAQAPSTEAATEAKPKCSAIASSTGERCTRNATVGETCKSHENWDNDEALAKFAKAQDFVESRREAAASKGKKGGKVDNKALAAALRAVGVTPNGDAWAKAKTLVTEGASFADAAKAVAK